MNSRGIAALELASHWGLRVFPCRERSKVPLIDRWQQRATTDPNTIRGWWATRDYNPSIATGPESGVWVLDFDGPEDEQWLRELEATHGKLPSTVEVISSRGRHIYFRWPNGADIRNTQARDDMPDVRGAGGYVLAPPSIHPSGHIYEWSDDSSDTFADAPPWLVDLVTRRETGTPLAVNWSSFVGETFEGSHRGSAIARLAGLLLRKFVEPEITLDLCRLFNQARCRDPLDDSEILDIVRNITRREIERRARKAAT